ncbi:protein odr-4 homolog isoform X2 [Lampris incognitus]|uniref:protein odr-4 homolog isoform X2 n=1 Tax=Lampris incognitus TaxID=2546036 RepID=UPI0024B51613|nr:protein odr-4 homolog isoform X2 [Lampris incognitus]
MGRSYMVEDAVEKYLSKLCILGGATPVTGLLIGQSSAQRDFVVMATQTSQRDETSTIADGSLDKLDLEWVTEHARQVSRMLPGGLSVLGVFIISDTDAKDALNPLRQLVFAVEKVISRECLWTYADDDITDRVTLHINSKTRKTACRTFDIKDPKSTAKPADWKYQSGVCSSWPMVSCCVEVDIPLVLREKRTSLEYMEKSLKEGVETWAQQIENGVFLIDGKRLPDDSELTTGQRKNLKQTFRAQLLLTPPSQHEQQAPGLVQQYGGSVSVRGAVHTRAYLHSNKPKASLPEKLLKRDMVSTVAVRVQMLMEELLSAQEENSGISADKQTDHLCLPRRVFCPVKGAGPIHVCDYQFDDEELSEVTDRLKEILDIEAEQEDLDATQEMVGQSAETEEAAEPIAEPVLEPKRKNYTGTAVATAVALLATAASLLYLNDY